MSTRYADFPPAVHSPGDLSPKASLPAIESGHSQPILCKASVYMVQVDSATEAAESRSAQQQAEAIAADNADGLGDDRRKAVLAEAEAATAGVYLAHILHALPKRRC